MTRSKEARPQRGTQTLARGLAALVAVSESPNGLTTQDVAERLSVHRSIAYRLLQTFVDFGLLNRSHDGYYRPSVRLAIMSEAFVPVICDLAMPTMRRVADELGSTIGLFIAEGDAAVALSMVEPTNTTHHMTFRAGMRTPLNRGAAAHALMSCLPPQPNEPAAVALARERGYATSSGEVASGAHGVAAPIRLGQPGPLLSLHLITYCADVAAGAGPAMVRAANEIGRRLSAT